MFRVLSLALVACLLMAGSAFADMKIGVFNSQAVAMDSDASKAAQQKLDLILDAAAGSVMYATPTLDITKPVLAEVNRLWKAGGSKFPEPNTGKK